MCTHTHTHLWPLDRYHYSSCWCTGCTHFRCELEFDYRSYRYHVTTAQKSRTSLWIIDSLMTAIHRCIIIILWLQLQQRQDTEGDLFSGPQFDQSMQSERAKLWLDDVVAAADAVMAVEFQPGAVNGGLLLPEGVSQEEVNRVLSCFFSVSLEFCWNRSVTLQNKTYRAWSLLRPVLQELIHKTFSDLKKGESMQTIAESNSIPLGGGSSSKSTHTQKGLAKLLQA